MRNAVPLFFALVLFVSSAFGADGPANTPPAGFGALFNGKDLSGWYGWNPHASAKLTGDKLEEDLKNQRAEFPNHWRVENDELVNAGTGPYATTDEEFGDIELRIEYQTVPHADSGVYLRGCPQVQIWDRTQVYDPKKPDRRPHLGSGGLFNNTPNTPGRDPLVVADKPFGEWNSFRIVQVGARTWVWLNDKLVVDGAPMENYWDRTKPFPTKGPIMLQTHGGEIRWRNIFVHNISADQGREILADAKAKAVPQPTLANVSYGEHERNVLDFYQAKSARPTPLLFFIHGGGWVAGDKKNPGMVKQYLAAGISVVSINYRYSWQAQLAGVKPPVKAPLEDAAHALQFVRSKAREWNIDKQRIGASGGSAGACSALWLAFHKDLADPKSSDTVAHESTRLWTAAVVGAQTSLDPKELKEWTPNSSYGGHAFGFMDPNDIKTRDSRFAEFLEHREEVLPWIKEYSPIEHVSADDPPVYLLYSSAPALGQQQKDPTHTANYGVKLQERCQAVGVECELVYPGAPDVKHKSLDEYLIASLNGPPRRVMKPTIADLAYGPHERNVLDFYQAKSDKPTPVLFYIHGGGWMGGDKNAMNPKPYLDAGISVISVNYRYISQAQEVVPPVKAPLHDAARALQFVRSKAKEWNLDKERIGASGVSAGACSSLWLAFHDDLADAKSDDPIARESTRLWCAAVDRAQTTLDPKQMREWTPNSSYGGHAFSKAGEFKNFDDFVAARERILPWIAEYSPYVLVTKDDPAIYLNFGAPPHMGQEEKDPTHSANFGVKLQEHCKEIGVPCELYYPGAPDAKHTSSEAYLIEKLKASSAK